MPLSEFILELLVCPACKGNLEYRQSAEQLICHQCRLAYAVSDDIPNMIVEEATPLDEENALPG